MFRSKRGCKRINFVTPVSKSIEISNTGQFPGPGKTEPPPAMPTNEGPSNRASKRIKIVTPVPNSGAGKTELPLNFQATITEMGGSNWRLVLQKNLRKSDVTAAQARFSMPPRQILPGSLDSGLVNGTTVRFIEPSGEELKDGSLTFKAWKLKTNCNYVLNGAWNAVAKQNGLEEGDWVQLWTFRVGSEIGFALVNYRQQREEEEEEEEENTGSEFSEVTEHGGAGTSGEEELSRKIPFFQFL